jgi:hypothetical protein
VLGNEEGSVIGCGLLGVYVWGGGVRLRFGENFRAVFGKVESGSATWIVRTNFLLDQGMPRKLDRVRRSNENVMCVMFEYLVSTAK